MTKKNDTISATLQPIFRLALDSDTVCFSSLCVDLEESSIETLIDKAAKLMSQHHITTSQLDNTSVYFSTLNIITKINNKTVKLKIDDSYAIEETEVMTFEQIKAAIKKSKHYKPTPYKKQTTK